MFEKRIAAGDALFACSLCRDSLPENGNDERLDKRNCILYNEEDVKKTLFLA